MERIGKCHCGSLRVIATGEPDRVYLHSGTREGARALGLAAERSFLPMDELPPELRRLKPREVEDLLCIYKGELKRLTRQGR